MANGPDKLRQINAERASMRDSTAKGLNPTTALRRAHKAGVQAVTPVTKRGRIKRSKKA